MLATPERNAARRCRPTQCDRPKTDRRVKHAGRRAESSAEATQSLAQLVGVGDGVFPAREARHQQERQAPDLGRDADPQIGENTSPPLQPSTRVRPASEHRRVSASPLMTGRTAQSVWLAAECTHEFVKSEPTTGEAVVTMIT